MTNSLTGQNKEHSNKKQEQEYFCIKHSFKTLLSVELCNRFKDFKYVFKIIIVDKKNDLRPSQTRTMSSTTCITSMSSSSRRTTLNSQLFKSWTQSWKDNAGDNSSLITTPWTGRRFGQAKVFRDSNLLYNNNNDGNWTTPSVSFFVFKQNFFALKV